jgi:hypothetical protein
VNLRLGPGGKEGSWRGGRGFPVGLGPGGLPVAIHDIKISILL